MRLFLLFGAAVLVLFGTLRCGASDVRMNQLIHASSRGQPFIAACSANSACIVAVTTERRSLQKKIKELMNGSLFCATGIGSDAAFVCEKLFEKSLRHSESFGSEISNRRLAIHMSKLMHRYTRVHQERPLAIHSVLLGLRDSYSFSRNGATDWAPSLYEITSTGELHDCKVSCIGNKATEMLQLWNNNSYWTSSLPIDQKSSHIGANSNVSDELETINAVVEKSLLITHAHEKYGPNLTDTSWDDQVVNMSMNTANIAHKHSTTSRVTVPLMKLICKCLHTLLVHNSNLGDADGQDISESLVSGKPSLFTVYYAEQADTSSNDTSGQQKYNAKLLENMPAVDIVNYIRSRS